MSYILDALRKAEQQRDIGHIPGIGSAHETAAVVGVGRWVWVLLLVLLLNAMLLTFALWPDSASKLRPVSAPVPPGSAIQPQASLPLSSAPASDRGIVNQPLQPRQPGVARQRPEAVPLPPAALTPLRPLPPPSEPLEPDAVEATEFVEPAVSEPAVMEALSPPVAVPVNAGDNNLPVWPQVSDQLFREINSAMHLDVHVYSDQPRERFVLLNMRKYHEGERLQEGPVVDAITPDGVILSFQGQRFRMQSQ